MNDKDQAAIDHVASVSKHPHAAMIVKWLITGWEVKLKNYEGAIDNPIWLEQNEYELIEQKPAKPAYRVYIEKGDNEPETVRREMYDKYKDSYDDKVEWISDWIEYDPPKKWPTPLVERIAAIDLEAAQWIVDHWDDLLTDKYTNYGMHKRESNILKNMFSWIESPQYGYYWEAISKKLGE